MFTFLLKIKRSSHSGASNITSGTKEAQVHGDRQELATNQEHERVSKANWSERVHCGKKGGGTFMIDGVSAFFFFLLSRQSIYLRVFYHDLVERLEARGLTIRELVATNRCCSYIFVFQTQL